MAIDRGPARRSPQDFDANYTEYQIRRNALKRFVRHLYLRQAMRSLVGPTLDFGCGIGDLLAMLPEGSKGLEYNRTTVEFCRDRGLDVDWYDGEADGWRLSTFGNNDRFESMIISHVLEHLDQPWEVLRSLLGASARFGIRRVLVVVPSRAGFKLDLTHRTFVDRAMLADAGVVDGTGFALQRAGYFPGNIRAIGDWFPHHELQALYVAR